MHKRFLKDRIRIDEIYKQFSLIPTVGVTWRNEEYKFCLCFLWLRWGVCIGVWRCTSNGK